MNYERLSQLLSPPQGTTLKISRAFVVKFGALLFAEANVNEGEFYRYSARQRLAAQLPTPPFDNPDLISELFSSLSNHPNVFNLRKLDQSSPTTISGDGTGAFISGSTYALRINLPKAIQKFQDMDMLESFDVISNGSYFMAFAEVKDGPIWTNIAHEYREIVTDQLEKTTRYRNPKIGPTPIWTTVYLVEADDSGTNQPLNLESKIENDDFFLVANNLAQADEIIEALFHQCVRCWRGFYGLMQMRSDSIDLQVEIRNRYAQAADKVRALAGIPIWHARESSKIAAELSDELSMLYESIVELNDKCWHFDEILRDVLHNVRQLPHFKKLAPEIERVSRRDFRTPDAIVESIRFLEKQIEMFTSAKPLLVASLVGGVGGAIVTGLIALALSFLKR